MKYIIVVFVFMFQVSEGPNMFVSRQKSSHGDDR